MLAIARPQRALALRSLRLQPIVSQQARAASTTVKYDWEDPLNLESQLTEDEIAIRQVFFTIAGRIRF
ncbi:hypothetical protein MD484_g2680, partial [Candolleomyces efflorescens]